MLSERSYRCKPCKSVIKQGQVEQNDLEGTSKFSSISAELIFEITKQFLLCDDAQNIERESPDEFFAWEQESCQALMFWKHRHQFNYPRFLDGLNVTTLDIPGLLEDSPATLEGISRVPYALRAHRNEVFVGVGHRRLGRSEVGRLS